MYSPRQIYRGLKNPRRASKFLKHDLRNYRKAIRSRKHRVINKLNYIEQRGEEGRIGLVINKGMYMDDSWGVASYSFLANEFIRRFDPIIISSQRIYDHHSEDIDFIFSFEPRHSAPDISYHDSEDQTLCVFASDPHLKTDWFQEWVYTNDVDFILSPYYDPFLYYFPSLDQSRLVHFPWAIPEQYIVEEESISVNDPSRISIFGRSGPEYYKERRWCRSFDFIQSYDVSDYNRIGTREDYYQWLRNFDAIIAAHSNEEKWQYMVAKFLEIPSGGSLLFAQDVKDIRRAGFNESNSVIWTRDTFEEQARDYLNDPESYLDTRKKGTSLIRSRHTISDRIDTIEELFKSKGL